MNKLNTLIGLVSMLLLATTLATAGTTSGPSPACCTYVIGAGCQGTCNSSLTCLPVVDAFQTCECQQRVGEPCHWDTEKQACDPGTSNPNCCDPIGYNFTAQHPICGCPDGGCTWDGGSTGTCTDDCSIGYHCETTFDSNKNSNYCGDCVPDEGCKWINDECTGTCKSGACVEIDDECTCPQKDCGLVAEEATFQVATINDFIEGPSCDGYCSNGGECVLSEAVGAEPSCYCKPPVNVPEFATGLVALAVMLLSPAFAYLVVRKRH